MRLGISCRNTVPGFKSNFGEKGRDVPDPHSGPLVLCLGISCTHRDLHSPWRVSPDHPIPRLGWSLRYCSITGDAVTKEPGKVAGNPTRTRDSGQCGGGTYQRGQDAPALLVRAALREDAWVRAEQQRGRQHPAGGPRGEGEERAPPPAPASCSPAPRARCPRHRQPRAPVAAP